LQVTQKSPASGLRAIEFACRFLLGDGHDDCDHNQQRHDAKHDLGILGGNSRTHASFPFSLAAQSAKDGAPCFVTFILT